ncbi:MAG: CDP-diacylglycerol--serine O-phosphatidyltransferase [Gammaproteobacteria bacterium]|nr:CDP-diacylglycerol--serine O-phosphatidyltransferase [Gammaproteobacteria bacterium]
MIFWQQQPSYPLATNDIDILHGASSYREQLLSLIKQAKQRIYITALYLQDDDGGRQILSALHEASLRNPDLTIKILVDFHRAQRGLIGAEESTGNAAMYNEMLQKHNSNVEVYGVPVKTKEMFGVLHLKGFIIDDTVLYSGASLNDIYLQCAERYRLDRYFLIRQQDISNAMVNFTETVLLSSDAVVRLDTQPIPSILTLQAKQKELIKKLKCSDYQHAQSVTNSKLNARLFMGVGRRQNELNRLIKKLFNNTEKQLVLYTPYFNFPTPLRRALNKLLQRGKKVIIVVGDKTANDFYQSPKLPFTKASALPYLYETILCKFVKNKQKFIDNGQLDVFLWWHNSNSFHLKGICVDERYHLLTGHNLNPRAWDLDIENGILIDDSGTQIKQAVADERTEILKHCKRINSYKELDRVKDYPKPVRKLLKKVKRSKADFIIKRFI